MCDPAWTKGIWILSSEAWVDSPRLATHVEWLLSQLEPKAKELRTILKRGVSGDIFCWSCGRSPKPPSLPRTLRGRAAALGLEIGIDHYDVRLHDGAEAGLEPAARVMNELQRLERDEDIVVLYAAESGSRAWGFASTDSDWDVRFVYVRPVDWYLSIAPDRDVIERPVDDGLDLSGWDLRKALALFRKGNAAFSEWLMSPIVYSEVGRLAVELRRMQPRYLRPRARMHHYLSMATKNYRGYLKGETVRTKKYFYVLRPLLRCAWIARTHETPPMEFRRLVEGEVHDAAARRAIEGLLARKRPGQEMDEGPRVPAINAFIEERMEWLEAALRGMAKDKVPARSEMDSLFRETLREAWAS